MTTNWNWLQGMSNDTDGGGMAPAPVFAGQKLVVVGGSQPHSFWIVNSDFLGTDAADPGAVP